MNSERFEGLVRRAETWQLLGYGYANKELRFRLLHLGSAVPYTFHLTTDTVHGRSVSTSPARSHCTIRAIELDRRLDVRHERYYPSHEGKSLLDDARDRVTLAYGRRHADFRWLVNLQGEYPLLSFLVHDLAEIRWEAE